MSNKNTSGVTGASLPVRPMNEESEPFRYPLVGLSSVSEDAQRMHRHGSGSGRLETDPFASQRYVSQEERKAFVPTERMLTAIAELEAVRLARYDTKWNNLYCHRVHEQYTVAYGRGSQIIRVSVFDEHPDEAQLLAVLIGGDLESRDTSRGGFETSVRARHDTATDVEHDASSSAQLIVRNITQPNFAGYGRMTFTGVLTEASLYPIGTDPLLVDDDENSPGEICTACEEHHPFAPFLPPQVKGLEKRLFVTVETLPFRPYLVAAPTSLTKES
jgi:hypothetical protein